MDRHRYAERHSRHLGGQSGEYAGRRKQQGRDIPESDRGVFAVGGCGNENTPPIRFN
jgi:hypothetical protein